MDSAYTSELWRKTQKEFNHPPSRQDYCCHSKAALHFPASFTYCPCHIQIKSSAHCPAAFCPNRFSGKNGKQVSSTTDAQNVLSLILSSLPGFLTPTSSFSTHFSKSSSICWKEKNVTWLYFMESNQNLKSARSI